LIWAKQFGDTGDDIGGNISLDSQNNIITSSYFRGTIDFDPGSGTQNLTANVSNTYILKLSNSGNFIWAKQFSGYSNNTICMLLNSLDNIYISGNYQNQVDFDPGMGIYNLNNSGGSYLSKLSSLGNFIWAKEIGSGATYNNSITLDNYGHIYNTGTYMYTQDFDPSSGTFNLTAQGFAGGDIYVLKLDTFGSFVWAKSIGGYDNDVALSVITKLSDVYIGGFFNDNVDFDPGSGSSVSFSNGGSDIFILKLDTMGDFSSVKTIGGINDDVCLSLCFDGSNNLYSTGAFQDVCDFNPNLTPYNLSSFGNDDLYIYKIESFTAGIEEINSENQINIYPNPSSKTLNISKKDFDDYRIEIINSAGQTVLKTDSNKNYSKLDISSLAAGLYFVKLSNLNKIQTIKFIKE